MKRVLFLVALIALATISATPPQQAEYQRSPHLGITFINSTDHTVTDQRYKRALFLGAGWTRWPLYWDRVETSPGGFNWSA
ncbi:MAG: hypothetical protein K8I30_17665, partial [Anaerolineae bacterium]|nr:hypothetical protein [Anaerolineae bacterium]